ncbi:uncharacterized protein B0I36DRAFT_346156 [Microdochium trichocladiopsis]|uniref:Uncharacterized protein n=1 Tax=Microdochium trichocladiopsis TaxID=1682393 RepID=A0A9P8YCC9_9PEZI|nr:uncharacterized protein B0I36DRAFT_346156 [Microdochium trichocladiopsis]KAH7038146.1 hypothetical protein B0I36DRAFT_346156 [Microdochium trichocladiopsis]
MDYILVELSSRFFVPLRLLLDREPYDKDNSGRLTTPYKMAKRQIIGQDLEPLQANKVHISSIDTPEFDTLKKDVHDTIVQRQFSEDAHFLDLVKEHFATAQGSNNGDVLLSLVNCSIKTEAEIRQFINDQATASYDIDQDREWTKFINELKDAGFPELVIKFLSKPSGPLRASLCTEWHYPTLQTSKPTFGFTRDRTNPCLRWEWRKIEGASRLRAHEKISGEIIPLDDVRKVLEHELIGDDQLRAALGALEDGTESGFRLYLQRCSAKGLATRSTTEWK